MKASICHAKSVTFLQRVLITDLQSIENVLLRFLLFKLDFFCAGIIGLIRAMVIENIFFLFRTLPHVSAILANTKHAVLTEQLPGERKQTTLTTKSANVLFSGS